MKKSEILDRILAGASMVEPRIGLIAHGVKSLIHRDDDPHNDIEETASALTEVVLNGVAEVEDLTGHNYVDDPTLVQLAANIKGDIGLYIRLVRGLKPVRAVTDPPNPT